LPRRLSGAAAKDATGTINVCDADDAACEIEEDTAERAAWPAIDTRQAGLRQVMRDAFNRPR
jgi:hypothetical protein